jgi:hypothetical protein
MEDTSHPFHAVRLHHINPWLYGLVQSKLTTSLGPTSISKDDDVRAWDSNAAEMSG